MIDGADMVRCFFAKCRTLVCVLPNIRICASSKGLCTDSMLKSSSSGSKIASNGRMADFGTTLASHWSFVCLYINSASPHYMHSKVSCDLRNFKRRQLPTIWMRASRRFCNLTVSLYVHSFLVDMSANAISWIGSSLVCSSYSRVAELSKDFSREMSIEMSTIFSGDLSTILSIDLVGLFYPSDSRWGSTVSSDLTVPQEFSSLITLFLWLSSLKSNFALNWDLY